MCEKILKLIAKSIIAVASVIIGVSIIIFWFLLFNNDPLSAAVIGGIALVLWAISYLTEH